MDRKYQCAKKWLVVALLLVSMTKVQSQSKKMCVTVDDLPVVSYGINSGEYLLGITKKLTDTFKKYDIPAIGYVNEKKLYKGGTLDSSRVELLRLWLSNGCDLGNHTFSHSNYHRVSFEEFTKDIMKGEIVTKALCERFDRPIKYFRHPYLRSGKTKASVDSLLSYLDQKGYIEAPVTIDNDDYLFAKAYHDASVQKNVKLQEKIGKSYVDYMEAKLVYFEEISRRLFDREIAQTLLVHASLLNADYLDDLVAVYQKHGYQFVSQEDVLKDEAYKEVVTKFGDWGISWLDRWALSRGKKGDFFKEDPVTPKFIQALLKK